MAPGLFSALKQMISRPSADGIGIAAPMTGKLIPLSEVPDEAFSGGFLGKGAAIIPADGRVYAPADAKVSSLIPSRHAVGLVTDDGCEILIHIGIDTVELDGEPFTCHVREGDRVKTGDLLITADLDRITGSGYSTHTPVLVTNSDEYASVTIGKYGDVTAGTRIMTVQ